MKSLFQDETYKKPSGKGKGFGKGASNKVRSMDTVRISNVVGPFAKSKRDDGLKIKDRDVATAFFCICTYHLDDIALHVFDRVLFR